MTLLELAVGIAVLLVGVLGFAQTLVSLERADLMTRQNALATQAARQVLESIQAEAFAEAFRRYNSVTADDPGGAGTAPGASFAVFGLSARTGDADGLPGEVVFPVDPASVGTLMESITDAQLGMPRDLNGDGDAIDAGITSTYTVLPVLVRVRWLGPAGPGQVVLRTLLGNW